MAYGFQKNIPLLCLNCLVNWTPDASSWSALCVGIIFIFKKMVRPVSDLPLREEEPQKIETENLKIQGEREHGVQECPGVCNSQEFVNG